MNVNVSGFKKLIAAPPLTNAYLDIPIPLSCEFEACQEGNAIASELLADFVTSKVPEKCSEPQHGYVALSRSLEAQPATYLSAACFRSPSS